MKNIILLFVFMLIPLKLISQNQNKSDIQQPPTKPSTWGKNKIGLTYSMMSGYGFSYWRELSNNFCLKTQLFGYGSTEVEDKFDNSLVFAIGLELQYTIRRTKVTRLYLLTGYYYSYSHEINYYYRGEYVDDYKENLRNIGIGFGFEVLAYHNLSFSLDGGYFLRFNNVKEYYQDENKTIFRSPLNFGIGFGVSAYYNI